MDKRLKELRARIEAEAGKTGCTVGCITRGKGCSHYKVEITYKGGKRKLVCSVSPSCPRAGKNQIRDTKKVCQQLIAEYQQGVQ